MKIDIFSHCTIDTIQYHNSNYEVIGGAACYGGITARKLNLDVTLHTKFGPDFPHDEYLLQNNIAYKNAHSDKPTTRFTIKILGTDRILILQYVCDKIEYIKSNADGFLVSPVYDEISFELFAKLKNDCNFIFLDPQGFMRRTDTTNEILLQQTDIPLYKINSIKLSMDEIAALVGGTDINSMKYVQKKGVSNVILTNKSEISMLVKNRLYSITLPNREITDTTGIGDIFFSAFCCTLLKENDFLWALCFGGGAAQAALDSRNFGLKKIPQRNEIETNGSYFYNTLKFKQV